MFLRESFRVFLCKSFLRFAWGLSCFRVGFSAFCVRAFVFFACSLSAFCVGLSCLLCAGIPRFACERGGDAGGAVNSRVVVFLALRRKISACGVLYPSERRFGLRCALFRDEVFRFVALLPLWKDAVLGGKPCASFCVYQRKMCCFSAFLGIFSFVTWNFDAFLGE